MVRVAVEEPHVYVIHPHSKSNHSVVVRKHVLGEGHRALLFLSLVLRIRDVVGLAANQPQNAEKGHQAKDDILLRVDVQHQLLQFDVVALNECPFELSQLHLLQQLAHLLKRRLLFLPALPYEVEHFLSLGLQDQQRMVLGLNASNLVFQRLVEAHLIEYFGGLVQLAE